MGKQYDAMLVLDDSVAITASRASTDILKVGANGNIGEGMPVYATFTVTEDFTASGAGTLTIGVQAATDAAFTAPITLASTGAIGKADLTAGAKFSLGVPPITELAADEDLIYYRAYYTVGTGPMTAGKIFGSLDRTP
jgi:hypothetical protein